jgi:hypothetical protein
MVNSDHVGGLGYVARRDAGVACLYPIRTLSPEDVPALDYDRTGAGIDEACRLGDAFIEACNCQRVLNQAFTL